MIKISGGISDFSSLWVWYISSHPRSVGRIVHLIGTLNCDPSDLRISSMPINSFPVFGAFPTTSCKRAAASIFSEGGAVGEDFVLWANDGRARQMRRRRVL